MVVKSSGRKTPKECLLYILCIPSSKLTWQWKYTFSNREYIFKWWITMLIYWRVHQKKYVYIYAKHLPIEIYKKNTHKDSLSLVRIFHPCQFWTLSPFNQLNPTPTPTKALRKPTVFHFEKRRPRHVGHNAVHRSISAGDLMTWWDNHPYKGAPGSSYNWVKITPKPRVIRTVSHLEGHL